MNRLSSLILLAACSFAQTPPAAAPAAGAVTRPDGLYATMKTSMGDIVIQLYEKETPNTVKNFVGLSKGTKAWSDPKTKAMVHRPMYNGISFHRIMMDGMIQGGDPTGKGDHECGVTIKDEIRPDLKFDQPGRLAMANTGSPNTGGCQWFITVAPKIPSYDGGYTIFGQVVDGQDVVKAISRVPGTALPNGGMKPKEPVKIVSVTIQRFGPEPAAPAPAKKAAPAAKKSTAPAK
jgi:cyclophilin family peptidyl-prolyl cis-trans isomerase